ncbi:uncharacterized protein N0V89_001547 [Didymosphaeria variabile]|uniref:F-box domain-containing protein n=1 Tax=Didymosphaeria variabile TaxID=1932322 RepID=A0A9W9CG04_9PLEO|nr:uncharacterized protein N0V89_001547 [Didymosphaeria variabile]KAJ4360978.1 hypothetical protein N0V89_001547 [Didymosphaeria variabile]
MVRAIAYGNWEQPIDANIFGIRSTWQGELRIPFACHIHQPSSTAPPNIPFHQFARLPAELQLRVLQFCDKPTLFRLMQTSHLIRTEATKLFFSDPEAWYCVEGEWLEMGGHPSDGLHDIDFLPCIQRLHVEFNLMDEKTWTDGNIRNFWGRVQCLFPQAKNVMVGDESIDSPPHPVGSSTASWPPPELHRRVCQLCPPDINVFVSILRGDGRLKRTLWRRVTIQDDDNETQELDECQNHPGPSIIVPHKPFRGQVGICQYLWSQCWAIANKEKALRVLGLAAIERHHFHGRHEAFGCPAPNCDAWFGRPEEFTTHVIRTARRHDDSYVLLEPYQSLFADGEKTLEELRQRQREIEGPFLRWWGKYGSDERRAAEKEFLRELEQGGPFSKQRWLSTMEMWE